MSKRLTGLGRNDIIFYGLFMEKKEISGTIKRLPGRGRLFFSVLGYSESVLINSIIAC